MRKKIHPLFQRKTLQMFGGKTVSRLLKRVFPKAKRIRKPRNPAHPELEIEDRRRDPRTGIERQVRHLWNASENPPRMERLLRKFSPRTRKDEEVQRAAEEKFSRSVKLVEWSKRDGYNIFVAFLQTAESDAYFQLRSFKGVKDGISVQENLWKQNGKLEMIEDIRLMFADARMQLQMYKDKKAQEAGKAPQPEQNAGA